MWINTWINVCVSDKSSDVIIALIALIVVLSVVIIVLVIYIVISKRFFAKASSSGISLIFIRLLLVFTDYDKKFEKSSRAARKPIAFPVQ